MADPTILEIKITEDVSFRLILVEGGSFNMGGDDRESEQPIHRVSLPSFYLAEYPVTHALWLAVIGEGHKPSRFQGSQRPVESVSWYDAAAFCNRLNLHCGYAPAYFGDPVFRKPLNHNAIQLLKFPDAIPVFASPAAKGFRLPSEAEWEYAALGGNKSGGFRYAGGDKLDEVGWYKDNSQGEPKVVGLKLANELGIYDLSGNVWEWCADQWHDNYKGAPKDGSAWIDGVKGAVRVLRGGCWGDDPQSCHLSSAGYEHPAFRGSLVGFRVLLGSPPGS